MKFWSVDYRGHTIRVESFAGGETRLLVDGDLQDVGYSVYKQLNGIVRGGDGAGEQIKASLTRSWFIRCHIFVDHRLVE